MAEKITPNDPRIQWPKANLNGKTYEYLLAEPSGSIIDTIFLIHGWPDLAFGWRYQVPFLLSLGYRVVAPNMMGYSGTDAPKSLEFYTLKRACDDLAALVSHLGLTKIVIGGHDWGGAVVYRFALRYPALVSKFFVICTFFVPPGKEYFSLTDFPNFKYQIQLGGPEVETFIVGREKLKQFFSGVYGGTTLTGEPMFSGSHGVYLDRLQLIGPPRLISETELNFYVESYMRNGISGSLNWYRTAKLNFDEEKEMANNMKLGPSFDMPAMYIACSNDTVLSPSLSEGMDIWFKNLKRAEIPAGHWAMVEKSQDVNRCIKEFLCETKKAVL
ncbi:Bifunctional epoxide hydrolase 2 [Erysiphe neolycopersici]|uniref:Bifunctional epoxide hydrolase 2 n=1 Tax=Erysiphe neolycopersici TaxID=212602 RepID=A0A420HT71_9PEZI|nr:Bifunctional epoxide hydrolase 2 [Erysiphe neolycopersici]